MSIEKKPLPLADAITLLDRLIGDEAFRAKFQQAPSEALAQINIDASQATRDCYLPGPLASIEVLVNTREQLTRQLTEQAMFSVPYCFIDGAQKPQR